MTTTSRWSKNRTLDPHHLRTYHDSRLIPVLALGEGHSHTVQHCGLGHL